MSTITLLTGPDGITTANSMTKINANFTNLNTDKIETSTLDTDTTLAANSDAKIATQKAVKAYVDAGGNVNASTTTKGIVEEATAAEVAAGTAEGATGARLFINPSTLSSTPMPVIRTYLNAGSPATWTKPAGLKYVSVELVGGGGGGDSTGSADAGGGGGGAGYSKKIIAAATLGTTETVTTGAGGAAENGGGSSSFGSHCSATGGSGATSKSGAAGGIGSSGDINLEGADGGPANGSASGYFGGCGGSSHLGGGGAGGTTQGSGGVSGENGNLYGGGGGGEAGGSSTASGTGGTGAAGIVIVTEYYI